MRWRAMASWGGKVIEMRTRRWKSQQDGDATSILNGVSLSTLVNTMNNEVACARAVTLSEPRQ